MTRYSVEILVNGEWEGLALFSDKADIHAMEIFCNEQFEIGNNFSAPCDNIRCLDMETGELIFDYLDEHNWDDEPADIDSDCGFDPYMGCFTDDC